MEKISYTPEKMDGIKQKIVKMIEIVRQLEKEFPGRSFSLDGHLVGSIGEVMAAYYYGIELYKASAKVHDGEINGRKVQIKIGQQDSIEIAHEPEYLIVLYLCRNGDILEVYNGPGSTPWESASISSTSGKRKMRVNKLMEFDHLVANEERIPQIHPISKMKKELKNKKVKS